MSSSSCTAKYLGFVSLEIPEFEYGSRPSYNNVLDAHTYFKDKKAIKKTQVSHPLFARGYKGSLSVNHSDESFRMETKDGSALVDISSVKIAYASCVSRNVYILISQANPNTFKCHAVRFPSSKLAESNAFILSTVVRRASDAHDLFVRTRARSMVDLRPVSNLSNPSLQVIDEESFVGFTPLKKSTSHDDIFGFPGSQQIDSAHNSFSSLDTCGSPSSSTDSLDLSLPRTPRMSMDSVLVAAPVFEGPREILCPVCDKMITGRDYICLKQCGHEMHFHCATSWRETHNGCPCCSTPLSRSSFKCFLLGSRRFASTASKIALPESFTVPRFFETPTEEEEEGTSVGEPLRATIAAIKAKSRSDAVKLKFNHAHVRIESGLIREKFAVGSLKHAFSCGEKGDEVCVVAEEDGLVHVLVLRLPSDVPASYIVDCLASSVNDQY